MGIRRIKTAGFSAFHPSSSGHGGERRSLQIYELLSTSFDHSHKIMPYRFNSAIMAPLRSRLWRSYNIPSVMRASTFLRQKISIDKLLDESHKYYAQECFIGQHHETLEEAEGIVWENTFPDFVYFPYIIQKHYRKNVIGCPHNLESLIPLQRGRWYGKDSYDYFRQEAEALRQCKFVFTISEEEQWLLNLLDIKAEYLPYFPAPSLIGSLLNIRKQRQLRSEKRDSFLIIGSIGNPPTRVGMMQLLMDLKKINDRFRTNLKFKVAGFGTEDLSKSFSSEDIEVLGSVTEERLSTLMVECKAIIINQGYSSGALTKVPENLICGVPVIISAGSARSFRRFDGVYQYNSVEELAELLHEEIAIPGIPVKPEVYCETFLKVMAGSNGVINM